MSSNRNNMTKSLMTSTGGEIQNIFSMILIFVFVGFIVYLVYNYIQQSRQINEDSPVIINGELDAFVARKSIELPQLKSGLAHTMSTWIYINDYSYNYGVPKYILWKGNPTKDENGAAISGNNGKNTCPQIYLYPETNTLGINTSTTFSGSTPEKCDIQNIPLMKWVHICYVLNNRSVDVYINGKLERSTALRGIPVITNDPLWITGKADSGNKDPGFYGKIGRTQYFTRAITPNEVLSIYNEGPVGNTLYKLTFFENNSFLSYGSGAKVDEKK
jgi:hypothetical protein